MNALRLAAVLVLCLPVACGLSQTGASEGAQDAAHDGTQDVVGGATSDADASDDADAFDGANESEAGDAAEDAPDDASDASDASDAVDAPSCGGVVVGGYCWYASAVDASCDDACLGHGACDLSGTRDYAGSNGTDQNCIDVLAALGYGSWPHQSFSSNDMGCQFSWGSYTYWSTDYPTTCESSSVSGLSSTVRMCACTE